MIETLIVLGCIFAAVALVLGFIFMPRTVAMLFGLHIAIPYLYKLFLIMGVFSPLAMVPLTIVFLIIFACNLSDEIIFIKNKHFNK